jgi:hypothetical protein
MEAYCFKCRGKCQIKHPERVFLANERVAMRGTCDACGGTVYTLVKDDAEPEPPPLEHPADLPPELLHPIEPFKPFVPPIHG